MIGQAEIHNGLYHLHAEKEDRLICSTHNNDVFKSNNKLDKSHYLTTCKWESPRFQIASD